MVFSNDDLNFLLHHLLLGLDFENFLLDLAEGIVIDELDVLDRVELIALFDDRKELAVEVEDLGLVQSGERDVSVVIFGLQLQNLSANVAPQSMRGVKELVVVEALWQLVLSVQEHVGRFSDSVILKHVDVQNLILILLLNGLKL